MGTQGTLSHHCGLITFWGTEHFEYVGHSILPKCLSPSMLSDSPYYFGDMSLDTGFLSILHNIYLDRSEYDEVIVYEIENPFNNLEFEETILDQIMINAVPLL